VLPLLDRERGTKERNPENHLSKKRIRPDESRGEKIPQNDLGEVKDDHHAEKHHEQRRLGCGDHSI
jgi:hypothetical protein